MIWAYVFLFLASFTMAALNFPGWSFIFPILIFFLWILRTTIYPVVWERDAEKVKKHLKKSKQPYYHFIYELLFGDENKAEQSFVKIKKKAVKDMAAVMLYTKQEKYEEAKEVLSTLSQTDFTFYYAAVIAQKQENQREYVENKDRIKDTAYRAWLEAEEHAIAGKKEEAMKIVEEQIKTQRGLKLLSAIHYKDSLNERFR